MTNLGKLQDQLSLVSSYTANVHKQMEVLGDAYIGSKSFISQLGTINLLMGNLQQSINDVFDEWEG